MAFLFPVFSALKVIFLTLSPLASDCHGPFEDAKDISILEIIVKGNGGSHYVFSESQIASPLILRQYANE